MSEYLNLCLVLCRHLCRLFADAIKPPQPSDRLIVWDHRRSPGCSDSRVTSPPRPPWVPFTATSHYPDRHNGRMNGLFYDTHVQALRPADLRAANFREPDSGPAVTGYPGE